MPPSAFSPDTMLDLSALDARRESIWRRLLEIDDQLANLEKIENLGLKSIDTTTEEIVARLKRQRKQYERFCDAKARELLVPKLPASARDEIDFSVDKPVWEEFTKYVKDRATEWSDVIVGKFDKAMQTSFAGSFSTLPPTPSVNKPPTNRVHLDVLRPEKRVFLPSTSELVLRFWSANKDISVLPAALLGLGYFAIVTWTEHLSKMVTTAATALVFPILLGLGWAVARKERRKLAREARDAYEPIILKFAKDIVSEALQEHEDALARWIHKRANAWKQAVRKHSDDTFFTKYKLRFQDKRRDLLLEKKCLEEKDRELQRRSAGAER